MIILIHGDNTSLSRNFYLNLKKNSKEKISFDQENIDFQIFLQTLRGGELFTPIKDVFIERLLSNQKKVQDYDKILNLIKENKSQYNFYFWESSELSKSLLSQFPDSKIELFKIPQNIFNFLDNIKPGRKENVADFHKALIESDSEMIFYMIIRQFRLLLGLESSIDEVKKLAPWQKEKLQRQAKFFTSERLKNIYKKLFEMDLGTKTGSVTSLTNSIDFFLLDI